MKTEKIGIVQVDGGYPNLALMQIASCEHVWNTHVVPLLQKIKEQDEFIEEGLDRNDRFDRAEKQWYDLHLKDQAENKALREEIERLKVEVLKEKFPEN